MMGSQIEPNGDFIEQWLSVRNAEAELDQGILALIDRYRKGAVLNETDLLESLITLSEKPEGQNDSD
jgi:hypothetical protein